jgi:ABC-type molybdate transport system permease subunit
MSGLSERKTRIIPTQIYSEMQDCANRMRTLDRSVLQVCHIRYGHSVHSEMLLKTFMYSVVLFSLRLCVFARYIFHGPRMIRLVDYSHMKTITTP